MPLVMIKSDRRAREKPCLRCGYSLRRLGDATHCPECGLSVWVSLNQNDSLDWSRPEWLRRMAVGLLVMAAACAVGLVAYVPVAIETARWMEFKARATAVNLDDEGSPAAYVRMGRPPTLLSPGAQRLVAAAGWLYLVLYFGGLALATWPERRYPDRLEGWRLGAWICGGAAALVLLYGLVVSLRSWRWTVGGFGFRAVAVAGALVTWGYLRQIARRMMNGRMARICGWLLLLPALSLLKVFPFFTVYLYWWLSDFLEFVPLLYLPAAGVMLVWFALHVWRAAPEAEGNWSKETAVTR
jgi:hypothetical protein